MSQASRSKVRARARHREQVARLIGQAGAWCITPPGPVSAAGSMRLAKRETFFDVAAARELGERMVSDGEALALERVPFVGWCMSRGLGPDNRERGAFVSVDDDCQWISHEEWDRRGNPQPAIGFAGEVGIPLRGGFPGKLAREWQRMGGGRNVAHGAELRRMGQRLLDAIAGQPSECQAGCTFINPTVRAGSKYSRLPKSRLYRVDPVSAASTSLPTAHSSWICPDCHGTGHNLAGVLPGLVWSAAVTRRYIDADNTGQMRGGWLADLGTIKEMSALRFRSATRTVPRGEHRDGVNASDWHPCGAHVLRGRMADRLAHGQRDGLASPIHWRLRLQGPPAPDGAEPALLTRRNLEPRWRRGELRHAEQRRAASS